MTTSETTTLLRLRAGRLLQRGLAVAVLPAGLFVVLLYTVGAGWAIGAAFAGLGLVLTSRVIRQAVRVETSPTPHRLD